MLLLSWQLYIEPTLRHRTRITGAVKEARVEEQLRGIAIASHPYPPLINTTYPCQPMSLIPDHWSTIDFKFSTSVAIARPLGIS